MWDESGVVVAENVVGTIRYITDFVCTADGTALLVVDWCLRRGDLKTHSSITLIRRMFLFSGWIRAEWSPPVMPRIVL